MKHIILPCNYLSSIGLKETFFLSYLVDTVPKCNSTLAFFQVNKKEILEKKIMDCLKSEEITSIIDKLFDYGFVFKCRKNGRITKKITLNYVNMAFFDMVGEEKYLSILKDYEDNHYIGKYIELKDVEYVNDNEFGYPLLEKYFSNTVIERKSDINAIYSFNIKKVFSHIKDGEFVPNNDSFDTIANIESMFIQGETSPFMLEKIPFGYGLRVGYKKFSWKELSINVEDESDSDVYVDEKTAARNDLMAYYKYLRISDTMHKPIVEWTVRDFIAYLYCGMAKQREDVGNFIFPDFKKDAYKFKVLIDKYGKKSLNKLIYYSYKHTREISEYCRIKDFNPTVSTFFVDWIVKKVFDFIDHYENNMQYDKLSKALAESSKSEKKEEVTIEKNIDNGKLMSLRKEFNENKPVKK